MSYTISDFKNTYSYAVKLIAGNGGMSREIASTGILDYELEPTLKNEYYFSNFHEGQFVLTTFLYAKDNPFLINDAVKHLIRKKASGLAIKNVLKLPINESLIRYADINNFPVFIIEPSELYFENIIFEVGKSRQDLKDITVQNNELNVILNENLSAAEEKKHIKNLNPSFENQFFSIYFNCGSDFSHKDSLKHIDNFVNSNLKQLGDFITFYKRGVIIVISDPKLTRFYSGETIESISSTVFPEKDYCCAGISAMHLTLTEFGTCIKESIHATAFCGEDNKVVRYQDLGLMKMIIPFSDNAAFQTYSQSILNDIIDYDAENNTTLCFTLEKYIETGCDIEKTAVAMEKHSNTIRYRLDKITDITSLDHKKFIDIEQLSVAMKMKICFDKLTASDQ